MKIETMKQFAGLKVGSVVVIDSPVHGQQQWTKQEDGRFSWEQRAVTADMFRPIVVEGKVRMWDGLPNVGDLYMAAGSPAANTRWAYGIVSVTRDPNCIVLARYYWGRFNDFSTLYQPLNSWSKVTEHPEFWTNTQGLVTELWQTKQQLAELARR